MVKIFEDIFIRFDGIHEHDGRMDRQTDTAWRHRPRLHSIAQQKGDSIWCEKLGATILDDEESLMICLAVLTQITDGQCDGQTDRQTDRQNYRSIYHAIDSIAQ